MKPVLFLVLMMLLPVAGLASETAYQALRVVGKDRGADVLNHVIEVQGRSGEPQPKAWKIILDEPTARGGVREIEVAKGKITSERTPVRAYSGSSEGAVMDFHKLNLDSEGAFTIAEKEASKARRGFDSVDFTLRNSDSPNAAPVWIVQLLDVNRRSVGSMSIAADTGAIVRSDLYGRRPPGDAIVEERRVERREEVVIEDRPSHDVPPPDDYEEERVRDRYDRADRYRYDEEEEDLEVREIKRDGPGVKRRIKNAFKDVGATLEGFFTGRPVERRPRDE